MSRLKGRIEAMGSNSTESVAVVVPAFNEEVGIERGVTAILKELKDLPWRSRLIVVDDGSRDKTPQILKSLQQKHEELVVVTHERNKGYGAGLRTGAKKADELRMVWTLFMDSDLTNDPAFIRQFLEAATNEVDVIKASRYVKGGGMAGVPLKRRLISRLGNLIAAALFDIGIKDCTNGFRMVRTPLLLAIEYRECDYSIIMEELFYLKKMRARVIEIPNILTSRVDSETHFRYKPSIFWGYFMYAVRAYFL